jgi:hypothetical protein
MVQITKVHLISQNGEVYIILFFRNFIIQSHFYFFIFLFFINILDVSVMFHIAPLMNEEQHRRLIGNDICVIIFYEDDCCQTFNPEPLTQIGAVPQVNYFKFILIFILISNR